MSDPRKPPSAVGRCPNCNRGVSVGQVITVWNDEGEMHFDCDDPYNLNVEYDGSEMTVRVLLGNPLLHYRLPEIR